MGTHLSDKGIKEINRKKKVAKSVSDLTKIASAIQGLK